MISLEFLVASAIAVLTAAGVYLVLRRRTFPVVLGVAFLSYAINVFLFAMGRLLIDRPPLYDKAAQGDHFLHLKNPVRFAADLETFLAAP